MRFLAVPLALLRLVALVVAFGVAGRALPELPPAGPETAELSVSQAQVSHPRVAEPAQPSALRVAPPARAEKLPFSPLYFAASSFRPEGPRFPSPELSAVWTGESTHTFRKRVPRMSGEEPPRSFGLLSIA
jgi:hypothetical protein